MIVRIPGVAFGALHRSDFPKEFPVEWQEIQNYSATLSSGRGVTVSIDISDECWQIVRRAMLMIVRRYQAMPYRVRGAERDIELQSLLIAIGRIDDATRPRAPWV